MEGVGISALVATMKKKVPFPEDMMCMFVCSRHKRCSRRNATDGESPEGVGAKG